MNVREMKVIDNTEKTRFEIEVEVSSGDGNGGTVAVAFADYRMDRDGKTVSVTHVFTPPELRGQGIAGKLMQGIVDIIRARGQKIHPICPYAVSWLNRHKQHQNLIS